MSLWEEFNRISSGKIERVGTFNALKVAEIFIKIEINGHQSIALELGYNFRFGCNKIR